MRIKDTNLLWSFILRTAMYIGIESRERIESFLIGYEIGTDEKCSFTSELSDFLHARYRITKGALGWPNQLERLAQQQDSDWKLVFTREGLTLLTSKFDKETRRNFEESFRKRITGKLLGIEQHFNDDWINDWYELCNLSADWFKQIWTEKEFQKIGQIEKEVNNYSRNSEDPMSIFYLKEACKALLKELKGETRPNKP